LSGYFVKVFDFLKHFAAVWQKFSFSSVHPDDGY